MNFETIRKNYRRGLWTKAMVKVAMKKGAIDEAQYREIVGEDPPEVHDGV